jgi:hypothetical protein
MPILYVANAINRYYTAQAYTIRCIQTFIMMKRLPIAFDKNRSTSATGPNVMFIGKTSTNSVNVGSLFSTRLSKASHAWRVPSLPLYYCSLLLLCAYHIAVSCRVLHRRDGIETD